MIDTKELRRLAQAAMTGPDGVSLNWVKLLQDFQKEASPAAVSELLDRLESAEKDVALKEEVIDSLAAVVKRLDAQCDALRAMIMVALDVLEEVEGNINPERGYADELEADVKRAIATIAIPGAKGE